jgi:ABC-type histidine transport system ATPase subunit
VLDSLRAEVTAGIEEIMQDVLSAEGGMQDRSIRLRMSRADEYLKKVSLYEKLTGETLAGLSGALEQAKQALAINRLLAVAV